MFQLRCRAEGGVFSLVLSLHNTAPDAVEHLKRWELPSVL